jgi:hypothetical protein
MRWTELEIKNYGNVLVTSIQPKEIEVSDEYYDEEGNELKEEVLSKRQAVFKNQDGNIVERKYKKVKVNDEWILLDKFVLTKGISKTEEVDKIKIFEVIPEKHYYAKNDVLLSVLQKDDKALKFRYSTGNGYKCVYDAYLTPYNDRLIMILGIDYFNNAFDRIEKGIEERKERTQKVTAKKIKSANEILI